MQSIRLHDTAYMHVNYHTPRGGGGMSVSTIKKSSTRWTKLGKYELAKEESTQVDVAKYLEFLVQFGDKNSGQPYGGMTYTDIVTGDHSKPSFIPLHSDRGLLGLVYVFQSGGTLTLRNFSRDAIVLFYLYVR